MSPLPRVQAPLPRPTHGERPDPWGQPAVGPLLKAKSLEQRGPRKLSNQGSREPPSVLQCKNRSDPRWRKKRVSKLPLSHLRRKALPLKKEVNLVVRVVQPASLALKRPFPKTSRMTAELRSRRSSTSMSKKPRSGS